MIIKVFRFEELKDPGDQSNNALRLMPQKNYQQPLLFEL